MLEVAERVFAAEGLSVPIDEIAKRAGVGVGTVYRHFPTKEALFAAIVQDKLARIVERVATLADDPEPGPAFFAVLDHLVAEGARKKDLVDALAVSGVDLKSTARDTSTQLRKSLGALLKRAQAAGAVRSGVTVEEVLALLSATMTAAERTKSSAARLFAIVRDGLRG
ncbi:Transcriptional regulator, TetR family protein [Minicystis rosea]|nr:Transcriptional regulator, TetR family protein [Minicystis rosea]